MLKKRIMGATLLVAAASTVVACGSGTAAQAKGAPPEPIVVETLTPRALFTDSVSMKINLKAEGHKAGTIQVKDASRILTTKVTVQPGAQIPWHTHHGPVFVTIAEGELTYVSSEGCHSQLYPAGTAFVDQGHGHVHTAYNSGSTVTVFVASFFESPDTGTVTIPADAPANCQVPPN